MKTMLVTGGAGFIGANFIRLVLQTKPEVKIINLDKLTYAGSLKNLEKVTNSNSCHYEFVHGDIANRELVRTLIKKNKIDTIVHFAAESHVDRSITSPCEFINTNILGTFNLLEAAREFSVERFHHISTDEVYGSLSEEALGFTEMTRYDPRSPYSASKAASDHLVQAYYHTYGLATTLSNCSNNFGPYQHNEKFIPTVIRCCLTQKTIPIYGNGTNIRDWLYVDDHCKAILCILERGKVGESYNIGANNEYSNLALATYICRRLDKLIPARDSYEQLLDFVMDRPGHDFRYAIDSSKIANELGWQPSVNFDDGMTMTLNFYTSQYGNYRALKTA